MKISATPVTALWGRKAKNISTHEVSKVKLVQKVNYNVDKGSTLYNGYVYMLDYDAPLKLVKKPIKIVN